MDEFERWKPDPNAPRVTPGHIRNLEQIAALLNSQFGRGLHTRSGFYEVFSMPPESCPTCGRVQDIIGYLGDQFGENWLPLQDCASFEHGIGLPGRELVAIWVDDHWQLRP